MTGMSVRETARVLGVDPRTVQRHLKKIRANSDNLVEVGRASILSEEEATAVKLRIERSGRTDLIKAGSLPRTELEKTMIIKQGYQILLERAGELEREIEEYRQDAAAFRRIADSDGNFLPTAAGKIISGHPVNFCRRLVDSKILYRLRGHLIPYQRFINQGYFTVKATRSEGSVFYQTFVTPRGLSWLARIWEDLPA